MLTRHLIILIILRGVSTQNSVELKNVNSTADINDLETMRLAKSELVSKYMNESIDPCENFYQFACGNWRTHHPATRREPKTNYDYIAMKDFDRLLIDLLNQSDDKYTEVEWKIKNYYDSCRNLASLKSSSSYRQYMKQLITEFGQMPALEGKKWQDKDFDWIKTVGDISYKYGIKIIFGYTLEDRDSDYTAYEIYMKEHLPLKFPDMSADVVDEYKLKVENHLKDLLPINTKTVKETAEEIIDFALRLWKAYDDAYSDSELTTFEEMHKKYSYGLDIQKLVTTSFGFLPKGDVYDTNPDYVETLAVIVKKTPKRVLANYIFYALVISFKMDVTTYETVSQEDCITLTKEHFLPVLSNMIYRRVNLIEKEQAIHYMWQEITETLQHILESNQLSWFDDDSREAALEKLHLMKLYIASYEDLNFEELYHDLTLSSNDFMENEKFIRSTTAKQNRKSLDERKNNTHFHVGDYGPSLMLTENVVRFPLSTVLTEFSWSKYVPNAINHGRLGSSIGHEIMHGFSGNGRSFDRIGNYIDWIYKDISNPYNERRLCYYKQYRSFRIENRPLHQAFNQGENIADNGGIYLAYHTYLRWLSDESRTQSELDMETLPNLNYTNKQLFFIGYSQSWCSDIYSDYRFNVWNNDEHSPDEFRGFVPLLNFGEFAKEFNCPSGSTMNPHKKCSIY